MLNPSFVCSFYSFYYLTTCNLNVKVYFFPTARSMISFELLEQMQDYSNINILRNNINLGTKTYRQVDGVGVVIGKVVFVVFGASSFS